MNYLKKADFFGVIFNWNLSTRDKKYTSAFGGLITILVYATSLLYFIYKIYLWKTNQILPTINTKEQVEEYIEQNFYGSQPLKVSMVSYGVDFFDWNKNILTCYFGYYVGYDLKFTKPLKPSPNNRSMETSLMIPSNITLVLNPGDQIKEDRLTNQFGFLLFAVCSQSIVSEFNITCASDEEITQYLSYMYLSQFKFQIEVQQYDPISQSLKTVQKDHYFNVDVNQPFQAQITYQINKQSTDSNLFYQQLDDISYIGQYNIITQPVSKEYIQKKFSLYGIAIIQFLLDKNVQQMNVLFPKLGSMLADVGSIMSTLLSLSIIVSIVNGNLLEEQLHQEIISFYYPILKNLQIRRNLFGKILEVKNNENVIDLDQYNFIYENLMEKVKIKLTLSNLIYEISRLQFIVQTQLSRQKILEFHNLGINIDFGNHVTDHELRDLSHQEHRDLNFLQFDDFNLLSMNRFQEEYKQIH